MIALIVLAIAVPVLGIAAAMVAFHYNRPDFIQDTTALSAAVWLVAAYVYAATGDVPSAVFAALFGAYYTREWIGDKRRADAA